MGHLNVIARLDRRHGGRPPRTVTVCGLAEGPCTGAALDSRGA
jgi:hypothetical protein